MAPGPAVGGGVPGRELGHAVDPGVVGQQDHGRRARALDGVEHVLGRGPGRRAPLDHVHPLVAEDVGQPFPGGPRDDGPPDPGRNQIAGDGARSAAVDPAVDPAVDLVGEADHADPVGLAGHHPGFDGRPDVIGVHVHVPLTGPRTGDDE